MRDAGFGEVGGRGGRGAHAFVVLGLEVDADADCAGAGFLQPLDLAHADECFELVALGDDNFRVSRAGREGPLDGRDGELAEVGRDCGCFGRDCFGRDCFGRDGGGCGGHASLYRVWRSGFHETHPSFARVGHPILTCRSGSRRCRHLCVQRRAPARRLISHPFGGRAHRILSSASIPRKL